MPTEIMVGQPKRKTSLLDAIGTAVNVASAAKGAADLGGKLSGQLSSITNPAPAPTGSSGGVIDTIPETQSPAGGTLGDALSRRAQLLTRGMTMRR
jgi:hypothetical protein